MSWTDKNSIKVMKYLRDKYNIKEYVETGTFKGINAYLHASNFEKVLTCEKMKEYYDVAKERLNQFKNVRCYLEDSPKFLKNYKQNYLKDFRIDTPLFYLDAHFYSPEMKDKTNRERFVVLDELKSLSGLENCVIIIHDFKNGLGHITYDKIDLDMDLVGYDLNNVNRNFKYYTNELKSCNIVKPDFRSIVEAGLPLNDDTYQNLIYAWKEPRLTYRGFLYCLPTELSKIEMEVLGLTKWGKII